MAENKKKIKESGAPRWTYIVGALVSTITIAWTITSHFIPKLSDVSTPVSKNKLEQATNYPGSTLVTGVSPKEVLRGVSVRMVVTGQNFPPAAAFAIDTFVCNGDYDRSPTRLTQTCVPMPGSPERVGLVVKDRSGGNYLPDGQQAYKITVLR